MKFITKYEGYEYAALTFATLSMVPQLYVGYRSGSLKDVSATTHWLIFFSSAVWGVHMYENKYFIFLVLTAFVNLTCFAILCMKFSFYRKRVNEHFKSFDQNAQQPTFSIMPNDENPA
tara:strand:+ start:144 stop:497 length:354 start_codon:yes stop_codon:yes gene_type:complete